MSLDIPDDLAVNGIAGYWGISPEAILLANSAAGTDSEEASTHLRRFYDIQVVRTNYKPDWQVYRETLDRLVETLLEPPLDAAARMCAPEAATDFLAGVVYQQTPSGAARALVHAQETMGKTSENQPVVISKPDLHGYTDGEDRELLRSLRILQPVESGYEFDADVLTALTMADERDHAASAWVLVYRLLETAGVKPDHETIQLLLSELEYAVPEGPIPDPSGSLPVYISENSLEPLVTDLLGEDITETCQSIQSQVRDDRAQLRECLGIVPSHTGGEGHRRLPFDGDAAAVCAAASRIDAPVSTDWLSEQTDWGSEPIAIHQHLREVGVESELSRRLVKFRDTYEVPANSSTAIEAYREWIQSKLDKTIQREYTLEDIEEAFNSVGARQNQALLEQATLRLSEIQVEPIEFIYTMFDPVHHADEYEIEKFTGERDELESEVRRIRRWYDRAPHDSASFANTIPEVLNYPLEHEDVQPRIRIMSPWINFAIQDYVGMIKRLLENDVSVQLLFRLPDASEWNALKQNFLSRIGDTGGNLELRTYTRYKQFRTHDELREADENEEYVPETGVHAKLFIAGGTEHGTVLAGSANLMENSIFYNPEAGIRASHPSLISAASQYFDFIWDLAEPDEIPESAIRGETNWQFYPKVYRP